MTGVCARSDAATKDEFSTSTPPARGSPERAEPEQGRHVDPSPLSWSNLRYVFDIKEDCNGKQGIHALSCIRRQRISHPTALFPCRPTLAGSAAARCWN